MLISMDSIPDKGALTRPAHRISLLNAFLASGAACAEYALEDGDNSRRAYNGLLMAVRRKYYGRVEVCWRHGRIFLRRADLSGFTARKDCGQTNPSTAGYR